MAADTARAMLDTVAALWPDAEVSLGHDRRRDRGAVAEFVVVPHAHSPRLLVPVAPRRASARAMLRFSSAVSARETAGRLALSALLGAGPAPFPDRVVVRGGAAGSLSEYLAQALGTEVCFSLGIGTARVNRKPVLQLFDGRGRCVGFAKIGDSDQARRDVAAEARALAQVSGRGWQRLEVPVVLHEGSWAGMVVLVQSALPTSPLQRPGAQWTVPAAAMQELTEAYAEPPRTLPEMPWLAVQRGIFDSLRSPRWRDALGPSLARLEEAAGDRAWSVGAWHGDWTPWNMARTRAGDRLQLWDWERFETGVPQGLDRFHYLVNAVTRRDGTCPRTVLAGLAQAGADPTRPGTHAHTLAGLYLVAVAGRYLPLSEGPGGDDIAARTETVVQALQAWARTP